ncbi:MAG: helix-turn-helix transcriptional regulator [Eubacterium sp.]|nr:helix-turn-helix transcriptional regulator [Eubacterium sp.]
MLVNEQGVLPGSDLYMITPSDNAKEMLFYLTSCGHYYTNSDYLIRREYYHSSLLLYLIDGQMSVAAGSKKEIIKPGQVCLLDCFGPHEYRSMGHAEFIWAHMGGSNFPTFQKRILQTYGSFVFQVIYPEEIKRQLEQFTYTRRNNQTVSEWRISEQIYHLLILLLDQHATAASGESGNTSLSESTQEAMDFIRANYAEQISLEDIAQAVSLSQYHFSRVFKSDCGYSPHEFLMITRMDRAMYLLKTTDLPIKTISRQVGYQNETTFTNAFTSRIGISPSKFRKFPI